MDGSCSKSMPANRKAGRKSSALRDRGKKGKQSHRIQKRSPQPAIRKSARLQDQKEQFLRHVPADISTNKLLPLPSPSPSDTQNKECSQPCVQINKLGKRALEGNWTESFGGENVKSNPPISQAISRKRKKTQDIEDSTATFSDGPAGKILRSAKPELEEASTTSEGKNHPIEFWAKNQVWPAKFAQLGLNMADQNPRKRSNSSSYTQGVRDGQNPRAHTLAHEREMAKYNMVMDIFQNQTTILDYSKRICADLLGARYDLPKHSLFNEDIFVAVFRGARARNEARLNRDITPLIVPSAELLHIRQIANLEHVIEEVDAEWNQCSTIFGPRPKSDYVAGLASSAFTPDEILKLKLSHTADCPSYVTDCLYFPFLICEVKSADRTIMEAERQAMHSSSIAVRAIVRLYMKVNRAEELNREILVLSVSHDPSAVKIHGHYALIEDEKITFFRHLIHSFDFTLFEGKDRWTAYHITRKIYADFYPKHLQRIRSAVLQLEGRSSIPDSPNLELDNDAEGPDSQELVTSAPSSQNVGGFKKPSLPSSSMIQRENEVLQKQVSMLLQQLQQQQEQQLQQQKQQLQQQEQQLQQQEQEREQQREQRRQSEILHKQIETLLEQQQQQQQRNDRLNGQIEALLQQRQQQEQ